jgi:hypothetical protein
MPGQPLKRWTKFLLFLFIKVKGLDSRAWVATAKKNLGVYEHSLKSVRQPSPTDQHILKEKY